MDVRGGLDDRFERFGMVTDRVLSGLGWADGYVRVGSFSADEFDSVRPEACGFFGEYFYVNLSHAGVQGVRSPAGVA